MLRFVLLVAAAACAAAIHTPPPPQSLTIAPGVVMPAVSDGAVALAESTEETDALALWFSKGGRGVDTAWNYNNQVAVGWALGNASAAVRAEVFVTTKIPCVASAAAALARIEQDLALLNIPRVDLLLIHSPGYGEPPQGQPAGCWGAKPCCSSDSELQATWAGLEQALARNLTRAIGVSNFRASHLNVVAATAEVIPAVNQAQMYVGLHDDVAIKRCRELGVTFEAYSPLGPWCRGHCAKPVLEDKTVARIAASHNVSSAQVGMKWILQAGHALVTASEKADYDEEDLDLWSFVLSEDEMAQLSAVKRNATTAAPALAR